MGGNPARGFANKTNRINGRQVHCTMSKRSHFGHIQRMAENKYRIYYYAGVDPSGKRVQKSKVIHGTRDEAEIELARRRIGDYRTQRLDTWGTFWNRVVAPSMDGLAEKTRHSYNRVWNVELKPRIADDRVADTDYHRVCEVIADIKAPSVQRAAHTLWKKMCNMALREELMTWNPVDRSVRMKPRNRRKKHVVDVGELPAWMSSISRSRYFSLAVMEIVGGMRHEEACGVMGPDIREEHLRGERYAVVAVERAIVTVGGRKVLKGTKTESSEREVWFAEPFAGIMLAAAGVAGRGPLVPAPGVRDGEVRVSRFANPQHVSRNWAKWCERNGVEYVRFGDMRSMYSNLQAEAGSPDSVVSLAMGHDDGTTRGRNYMSRQRRALAMIADNLVELIYEESRCSYDALTHSVAKNLIVSPVQ